MTYCHVYDTVVVKYSQVIMIKWALELIAWSGGEGPNVPCRYGGPCPCVRVILRVQVGAKSGMMASDMVASGACHCYVITFCIDAT